VLLLAVELGNADTELGLLRDGEVEGHWRVSTDPRRTADEWAVVVRGLLGEALDDLDDLDGVAVASTVPTVLATWREMLATRFPDLAVVVVGPGVRTGLPVSVDNPREVGADRIVNSLAALTRWGAPVVVVDLGATATTYDVVNSQGRYVGGAIAPGITLSHEALGRGGAQLREVPLERPPSVIGRTTVEALQSGLVHGAAAQVEGLLARIVEELGVAAAEVAVVATGSGAPLVVDEARCFTAHDPWLALRGLALVFTRNIR